MKQIAIVDDEEKSLEKLSAYIEKFMGEIDESYSVKCFRTGPQFLDSYDPAWDIVFLDIEMPGMNGMETARELRKMDEEICIIFVTNMARFAIKGYEVNALDFIVKPVQYATFEYRMKKAMKFISRNEKDRKIFLQYDGEAHKLDVMDIYYVEAVGSYVLYHTANGVIKTRGPLKNLEEHLVSRDFVRSNHCYLVNLRHVSEVKADMVIVHGQELKISRNKKKEFISELTKYMGRRL